MTQGLKRRRHRYDSGLLKNVSCFRGEALSEDQSKH